MSASVGEGPIQEMPEPPKMAGRSLWKSFVHGLKNLHPSSEKKAAEIFTEFKMSEYSVEDLADRLRFSGTETLEKLGLKIKSDAKGDINKICKAFEKAIAISRDHSTREGLRNVYVHSVLRDSQDPRVQIRRALNLLQDNGAQVDGAKELAKIEHPVAKLHLGICYLNGRGVKKNIQQAIDLLQPILTSQDASEETKAEARCQLGLCYLQFGKQQVETGLPQAENENLKKARAFFDAGSKGRNVEATYQLAVCYRDGIGVEVNPKEAFESFKKAAQAGHIGARFQYGLELLKQAETSQQRGQSIGETPDNKKKEAATSFLMAAKAGNHEAEFQLGVCLEQGIGIKKNLKEAKVWFERAAIGPPANHQAELHLGLLYLAETGVKVDLKTSEISTDVPSLSSWRMGVKRARENGAFWLERAANDGNSKAQYNLGFCHEHGIGVTKATESARSSYEKARSGQALLLMKQNKSPELMLSGPASQHMTAFIDVHPLPVDPLNI